MAALFKQAQRIALPMVQRSRRPMMMPLFGPTQPGSQPAGSANSPLNVRGARTTYPGGGGGKMGLL